LGAQGSRALEKVLVVGAGQMGSGIAQVAAQAGLSVHLVDADEGALGRALEGIMENLERARQEGRISTGERDEALGRVATGTDYTSDADVAIEAATEDLAVRRKIFEGLDCGLDQTVILATNTSSIPVTRIASATGRLGKVIGMHFSNPVPVMGLVEVIRGLDTSDETHASSWAWRRGWARPL
jgi:3-hydroxybutyryl-CoA dehydrogenase